jgi:hypothetical protein
MAAPSPGAHLRPQRAEQDEHGTTAGAGVTGQAHATAPRCQGEPTGSHVNGEYVTWRAHLHRS